MEEDLGLESQRMSVYRGTNKRLKQVAGEP